MGKHIEGKIVAHDRHQFELKLGYVLDPALSRNKYDIELYFFIPKSLGINSDTYDKRSFFNDVQSYIRFKTPVFSFDQLVDPANKLSPLTRLKELLSGNADRKKLIAETKLCACMLRVALRNSITQIRRLIKKGEANYLKDLTVAMGGGLKNCLGEFRNLTPALEQPLVHEDARIAFRHADEYLGIVLDGLLNSLHNTMAESAFPEDLVREVNAVITPIIADEFRHRKSRGYATYSIDGDNELFLYRKGVLKKIITSILFLRTHTHEGMTFAKDIVFAVAAGIAMVLATIVTVWAGQKWGSTSIPFVLAIVIGYMAKDRIKDWCKFIFSKKMTRLLSDFKTDVLDPATEKKIGVCRQAFSFISEKKIPPEVVAVRRRNTPPDFWLPEDVIKYEKDVFLKPGPIFKAHARLRNITDIIRFNMHQLLDRMDEPYEIRRAIDPETGNMASFTCARVYHVNIVLKLEGEIRRMRVVLNQNGIIRIEEVK